jgi:hypothetical protein
MSKSMQQKRQAAEPVGRLSFERADYHARIAKTRRASGTKE